MKDVMDSRDQWLGQFASFADLCKFGYLPADTKWDMLYSMNHPIEYSVWVPTDYRFMRWPYSPHILVYIGKLHSDEYSVLFPRIIDGRLEPIGRPNIGDPAIANAVLGDVVKFMKMPYDGGDPVFSRLMEDPTVIDTPTWWNYVCYIWNVYAELIDGSEKAAKLYVHQKVDDHIFMNPSFVDYDTYIPEWHV